MYMYVHNFKVNLYSWIVISRLGKIAISVDCTCSLSTVYLYTILLKIIEGPEVQNEGRATYMNNNLEISPKLFFYSLDSSKNHFQLTLNHKSTMINGQTHLSTKTRFFSCVGGVMKFSNIGERQMKLILKQTLYLVGQISI